MYFYSSILVLSLLVAFLDTVVALRRTLKHANILDREEALREEYDYVIIGGGTAGCTVADRLTADGKYSVLVIEYGYLVSDEVAIAGNGRDFNDPGIRYNITSVPQVNMNNRTQAVWIGCCVGGSSAINGMILVRGTRIEYNGWEELGGPGSTWGWEGVIPYFRRAVHFNPPNEQLAEQFNITWDPDSWNEEADTHIQATFPTYQNPAMIPMYEAMTQMPGVKTPLDGANGDNGLFWFPTSMDPTTFWRSYARTGHYDNIKRPNYEVMTRHKVNKILFEGNVAIGVEFTSRDGGGPKRVLAKKEVILSAGSVHTPQVLQLSGIGDRRLLNEAGIDVVVDLPGVGQNFQDHALLNVPYRWGKKAPTIPTVMGNGDPKTVYGPNLGAWVGLPVMTDDYESIAAKYEAQPPEKYLPPKSHPTIIAGYAAFQRLHAKLLRSRNTNVVWLDIKGPPGGIVTSMHVLSHGTILINSSSPHSEPIVDYRALSNPMDLDLMVENIKFMRKYMASPYFAPYEPIEIAPGINVNGEALREWVRTQYIPSEFHPIATASKKPRDLGGVVGEDLSVHGTERLFVIDASIMPMLPGANTQQSTYMIAEKAVDMIKARQ